jgi:Pyruvate/2-oxoglutarate dehydrogenase complex, dihydrolipoamide acyltransferase (E2) component, and related enzymes
LQTIYSGNVEIVEMDRMRKLIAEHMVRSKQTSPHVTSFTEADVTHLVQWRDRVKKEFESREGEKLTFTPLLLRLSFAASRNIPGSTAALTVQN